MKKLLIAFIFCLIFISSGCSDSTPQKTAIIMSSSIINAESAENPEQRFKIGQRINYAVVAPKGFKDSVIRAQIVRKSQGTALGGFELIWSKDIVVDTGKRYHIDNFTLSAPGYYIMRIFEIRDLENQIAIYDFFIQ